MSSEEMHKKLIKIIKNYSDVFGIDAQLRSVTVSTSINELSVEEINNAVTLLGIYLNLTSASVGNFDLYELLQAYFRDEESREEINECVHRSLARQRAKG